MIVSQNLSIGYAIVSLGGEYSLKKTMFFDSLLVALLLFSLISGALIANRPVTASFDLSQAAYYNKIKNVLSISPEQEMMLKKYGFVSVETPNQSTHYLDPRLRFEDFYHNLVYCNDLPVFVTTDSILHLFHVAFDCTLKIMEKEVFYSKLLELTEFAFNSSLTEYGEIPHDGSMKYWAVRNSTVYFGVALSLLTGESLDLPLELTDDISFYVDNILSENLQFLPAGEWLLPESPYAVGIEYDFTQFKVRGHYLGDKQLERYFVTMMWYGQYPIFIPRNDEKYLWIVPHINEVSIVYMRDIVKSNSKCYENWQLLYNVTCALIGESDSINLLNLETALHKVFGDSDKYLDFVATENGLKALKEELSKPEYQQMILGQAVVSETLMAVLPRYPIVFQFMGQRLVPDSYMFQRLCWDKVGPNEDGERRILPKGIDVFAVLGSERAYQLLIPDFCFDGFEGNLTALKEEFNALGEEDWVKSSYLAWVHALESLIDIEYDENYPEFMRNLAWQDEKLNTALGSWAQLRRDTILYAKQTYIPATICSYPEAFVEPNPAFYSRMQKLSEKTLEAVDMLGSSAISPVITYSLQTLKNATKTLETISTKELAKEPLTSEEINFIKRIAWNCGSGGSIGWYVDTIHCMAYTANSSSILDAPVIADVATFPPGDIIYPPQILHVGVGYVNAMIVLFPKVDGTLVAAVGPVFTYYEFGLVGTTRLNDKEWKTMLTWSNRTCYLPEWLKDVYGSEEPMAAPEFPNSIIIAVVVALTLFTVILKKVTRIKNPKYSKPH